MINEIEIVNEENFVENNEGYISMKPLWNPKHFFWMSIIFSFIPISVFFISNFNRMREFRKRNIGIALTLFVSIAIITLAIFIDSEDVLRVVYFPFTFGIAYYYRYSQVELYNKQIDKGVKSASFLLPTILSILVISVIVFINIAVNNYEEKYEIKTYERYDDYIYFWSEVNIDEVISVADYFEEINIFGDDHNIWEVGFYKEDEYYIVSFVLYEESIKDVVIINELREIRTDLADKLNFMNRKIKIELRNPDGDMVKVIS